MGQHRQHTNTVNTPTPLLLQIFVSLLMDCHGVHCGAAWFGWCARMCHGTSWRHLCQWDRQHEANLSHLECRNHRQARTELDTQQQKPSGWALQHFAMRFQWRQFLSVSIPSWNAGKHSFKTVYRFQIMKISLYELRTCTLVVLQGNVSIKIGRNRFNTMCKISFHSLQWIRF